MAVREVDPWTRRELQVMPRKATQLFTMQPMIRGSSGRILSVSWTGQEKHKIVIKMRSG